MSRLIFRKKQLIQLKQKSLKNKQDLKNVQCVNLQINDISFNKQRREIVLLSNYVMTGTSLLTSYSFANLTDIEISSIIPYVTYSTENGYSITTENCYYRFESYWKQTNTNTIMHNLVTGYLIDIVAHTITAPLYVTLKLVIQNAHTWDTLQKMRT